MKYTFCFLLFALSSANAFCQSCKPSALEAQLAKLDAKLEQRYTNIYDMSHAFTVTETSDLNLAADALDVLDVLSSAIIDYETILIIEEAMQDGRDKRFVDIVSKKQIKLLSKRISKKSAMLNSYLTQVSSPALVAEIAAARDILMDVIGVLSACGGGD